MPSPITLIKCRICGLLLDSLLTVKAQVKVFEKELSMCIVFSVSCLYCVLKRSGLNLMGVSHVESVRSDAINK